MTMSYPVEDYQRSVNSQERLLKLLFAQHHFVGLRIAVLVAAVGPPRKKLT
jgi:hypothetical protein